ncbi:MAG: 3,4-dihydroxy-2-butanone-4-phosphate synthase [Pseudomonadota bacterium]|jgi:3,4-dihydroxy 2-butanone 4-phosphate synthase/GTP cyclohydrolase II
MTLSYFIKPNADNQTTLANTNTHISSVKEIVAELAAGRMVVVVDDEDRENEGDLLMAADCVTPEAINFMARYGRGLVCLTLTAERCEQLKLPMMTAANGSSYGTNFTVSIEAAEGVTTGISAQDRAVTILAAVAKHAKSTDIVQPGHIFPLKAVNGGVLVRAGHTEAGCDLARMAGSSPAAVICEILNDDGTMARLPDLLSFAAEHNLKIGTIADLIEYRAHHESLVQEKARRQLTTPFGEFTCVVYTDTPTQQTHLALLRGEPNNDVDVLVRVHEPLSTLDWLDSNSQHTWSLLQALQTIAATSVGVLVLLNCEESASGLLGKFIPQPVISKPPKPLDLRTYGLGAHILKSLGVRKMRLMTNPTKMPSMSGFGLEITGFLTP